MKELTLVFLFLLAINFTYQEPIEELEQVLVYPVEPATKKTKRESSKTRVKDLNEFIEDKLIQHTQALEHLVQLVESNKESINQLVENLSFNIKTPRLPEKIESRRAFGGNPFLVSNQQKKDKPSSWCLVAVLCKRTMNQVCGFDDNFGYGKFDDVCHMLQVNCYWKYTSSLARRTIHTVCHLRNHSFSL